MEWWKTVRKIGSSFRRRTPSNGPEGSGGDGPGPLERNYEDWYRTQFEGIPESAPSRQLVIGLDFGTSYTKVALGEVRVSYAVPFMGPDGQASYLLPTILRWAKAGDDAVHLESDRDSSSERIDRLKIRFLEGDTGIEARVHNAAYLALVLRHVRGWLMNQHAGTYGGSRLDWLVNIGLPTDTFFGNELASVYQETVRAAWDLGIQPGPVTMSGAYAAFTNGSSPDTDPDPEPAGSAIHPDKISAFPELAAAVAGYLRSPMRREDLHLLMDVGAGTLDVALFTVWRNADDEPLLPILGMSVTQNGTAYLMKARLHELARPQDIGWSYQNPVPGCREFARQAGAYESSIREVDEEFRREITKTIIELAWDVWKRKYSHFRRRQQAIPLIACGGGMASSLFEEAVTRLVEKGKPLHFSRLRYPKPEKLEVAGAASADIDRLNVAYGLSFDPLDIAHTRGPDEISDDPYDPDGSDRPSSGGTYIDKGMV